MFFFSFLCVCVWVGGCFFFFLGGGGGSGGFRYVLLLFSPVLSGEVIKFDLRISHVMFSGGLVQPPTSEPPAGMTGKVMES